MKLELDICRIDDPEATHPGQLVYHNRELLRVEKRYRSVNGRFKVRYYRIGKINLDSEMREAERKEFHKTVPGVPA